MNVVENIRRDVENRIRWVEQAKQAEKKALELPESIQNSNGVIDQDSQGMFELMLFGGDKALKVCEEAGVIFDTPQIRGCSDDFEAIGMLGEDVTIRVIRLSAPANCTITKVPYTSYRYYSECNEQAPEL